jgi:hypothetical protein
MRSHVSLLILLCLFVSTAQSQDKVQVKFGSVKAEDFKKVYSIDSSAGAVIIADVGNTRIIGNTKGWFSWEFVHFKRIHILNKSAFDVSNVTIPLYSNGDDEEELVKLKAYTYNLENGKVVETKLDSKKGVFKDKLDRNRVLRKFTFPDVKEGSIIEYEYTVKSDFLFNLQPWTFQGSYPRLWSEYNVRIPRFISYVTLMQGYLAPHIRESKDGTDYFSISASNGASASEHYKWTDGVTSFRWVMKDVPVLKEESFTSSLDNHISKIEFQLSEYKDPLTYRNVMGTWPQLTKRLMEAEYFGGDLSKNNGWIGDMIDPIIKSGGSQLEIAYKIYRYVQKNFTCTSRAGLYANENIKNVGKTKKGTVGELNLLLTAMMRYANIQADPVILSTKSNGYTYSLYPLIDRFNYTISQIVIDNRVYYLDASNPQMGFGRLSPECYNGHARVVDPMATAINFTADSLLERKITSVLMINNDKGGIMGSMQKTPGYFESYNLRRKIKDAGLPGYMAELQKGFLSEVEIKEPKIDSMDLLDMPVKLEYQFEMPETEEDIMYFSPMMTEAWKENPFKAAKRYYPVEMPYTIDETYLLRMDVPKGFEVEEMPKQIRMKLNENDDGFFEYLISNSNGVISMRSRLRLSRTYFLPEEYEMLREFFAMVVQKQGEQIVFKKKV